MGLLIALAAGCKALEKLHLMGLEVDRDAAATLAELLHQNVFPKLQELHLGLAGVDKEGVELISDTLREGKAPALRSLNLDCGDPAGFDAGAFRALGEALESGVMPGLERLMIRMHASSPFANPGYVLEAIRRTGGDDDMLDQPPGHAAYIPACEGLAGLVAACPGMKPLRLGAIDEEEEEEGEEHMYGGESSDADDDDDDCGGDSQESADTEATPEDEDEDEEEDDGYESEDEEDDDDVEDHKLPGGSAAHTVSGDQVVMRVFESLNIAHVFVVAVRASRGSSPRTRSSTSW
jgi:hypothetical protein